MKIKAMSLAFLLTIGVGLLKGADGSVVDGFKIKQDSLAGILDDWNRENTMPLESTRTLGERTVSFTSRDSWSRIRTSLYEVLLNQIAVFPKKHVTYEPIFRENFGVLLGSPEFYDLRIDDDVNVALLYPCHMDFNVGRGRVINFESCYWLFYRAEESHLTVIGTYNAKTGERVPFDRVYVDEWMGATTPSYYIIDWFNLKNFCTAELGFGAHAGGGSAGAGSGADEA